MDMINCSLFLHGTPSSISSTSKVIFDGLEERLVEELFQDKNISSTTCYLIYETRLWSNFTYSVYTYYKRVSGYSGRSGCYCALTLIVKDNICLDFQKIYKALETLFHNEVEEHLGILKNDKYLVSSFAEIPDIEHLNNKLESILQEVRFVALSENYHISNYNSEPECFNVSDVSSDSFAETLQRDGKVFISPNYETLKDKVLRFRREQTAEKPKHLQQEDRCKKQQSPQVNSSENNVDIDIIRRRLDSIEIKMHNIEGANNQRIYVDGIKSIKPIEWFNMGNFVLLCLCLLGMFKIHSQLLSTSTSNNVLQNKNTIVEDSLIRTILAWNDSSRCSIVRWDSIKTKTIDELKDTIKVRDDSIIILNRTVEKLKQAAE